jgi:cytochrome c
MARRRKDVDAMRITRSSGTMWRAAIGATLAALALMPAAAADANHGKSLFQACVACHNDGSNPLGPNLHGVFGRKAGTLDDYRYSNAMTRANLVWDEANLKAYIGDPQGKVKGNRMPFGGITDPKEIDDIVAFLKDYK